MNKLLVVEDDAGIVSSLTEFLQGEGFQVRCAEGQKAARQLLQQETFDLALLDITLPDGSGYTLCSVVKEEYHLPVIFLTASGDEYSTVTGFHLGADDYIAKPFRPRELVMRIRNILRLTGGAGKTLQLGDITVDPERGTVRKAGTEVYLSALEYRLLLHLLSNRGIVISRDRLLEAIWSCGGEYVSDNTLTVYIKRLREKLEDDPQNPVLIRTVRGMGYRVD